MVQAGAPRILVVPDDPAVGRVVGRVLRSRGCEVVEAMVDRSGLEVLLENSFDAVVYDVDRQCLETGSVPAVVSGSGANPLPPFVLLVTFPLPLPRGRLSVPVRWVTKPFRAAELWAAVSQLLAETPRDA